MNKSLIIGVGAVIVVIGGIALAALRPSSPEALVASSFNSLKDAETVEYSGIVTVDIDGELEANAEIVGAVDWTDIESIVSQLQVNLTVTHEELGPKPFTLSFETRSLATDFYIQLVSISDFGLFDLSSFTGTWLRISKEELAGQSQYTQEIETDLTEEQRAAIWEAFEETSWYSRLEEIDSSGGVVTYAYDIDAKAAFEFLLEVNTITQNDEALTEEEIQEVRDWLSQTTIAGTFSINKGSAEFTNIATNVAHDNGSEMFVLKSDFDITTIESPLNVAVPAESVSLEELIEEWMGSAMLSGFDADVELQGMGDAGDFGAMPSCDICDGMQDELSKDQCRMALGCS